MGGVMPAPGNDPRTGRELWRRLPWAARVRLAVLVLLAALAAATILAGVL
jgi:hypothetical protein